MPGTLPSIPYTFEFLNPLGVDLVLQQDPSGTLAGGQGATVWDSALCLAKYIEKQLRRQPSILDNARILEIGAGTGLVGLSVAMMTAGSASSVILVDAKWALPLLTENVLAVQTLLAGRLPTIAAALLNWGSTSDVASLALPLPPTHVLISDCLYDASLYGLLVDTIAELCDTRTCIWIAYEKRDFRSEMDFWELFGKRFTFKHVELEEQDEIYRSDDIFLFTASKRGTIEVPSKPA
ncbi:Methyltransferase-like protein 21D [Thoreauomyces humboldtii]|nr:Methyltransferase-like protein 21D [Thoreauomyces humboldtii]